MPPAPPKKKGGKRKPADDMPMLTFEMGDRTYTVDSDVSSADDLALYQQSGLTFADIGRVAASGGNPPPFIIAALMFLAERQAGNATANYQALADGIGYADLAAGAFRVSEDDDEAGRPEA